MSDEAFNTDSENVDPSFYLSILWRVFVRTLFYSLIIMKELSWVCS